MLQQNKVNKLEMCMYVHILPAYCSLFAPTDRALKKMQVLFAFNSMSDKPNLKKKKNTTVLSYLVIEPNNFVILPQSLLSPLRYPASRHQPSSTCSNPLACWQCCIGEKSQIVRFIFSICCPNTTFLLLICNPGLFLCHFFFY